jgi:hypothetical protein
LTGVSSKFSTETFKTLSTKIVEQTEVNIFCKADLCFDQPFEHKLQAKLLVFHGANE